jgi:uncharacterized membrane protein
MGAMHKLRVEMFSDGVIAVIITILVLDLHAPEGMEWRDLAPLLPDFLGYVLTFLYLGIYWSNHHHMLQAADHVNGAVLLANLHLLFWLSLTPFTTRWMSDHPFATVPVVVYGLDLLLAAIAYTILERTLIRAPGEASALKTAVGDDVKGWASIGCYVAGIVLALVGLAWIGLALYALVALMWLVPDRRIERFLARRG